MNNYYISYLLVYSKSPQNLEALNNKHSLTILEDQKYGNGLTEWFWLKASKENRVKLSPCGTLHRVAHIICQLASPRVNGPRKVGVFKTESQLLYIPTSAPTNHGFRYSLSYRNEPLCPVYTQGEKNKDLC